MNSLLSAPGADRVSSGERTRPRTVGLCSVHVIFSSTISARNFNYRVVFHSS